MKRFITMMLLAVSASTMMAQGSQQVIMGDRWFNATLSEFSFQGQVQMFIHEDGNDNGTESFVFYDDDFSQQGTLTVTAEAYDYFIASVHYLVPGEDFVAVDGRPERLRSRTIAFSARS